MVAHGIKAGDNTSAEGEEKSDPEDNKDMKCSIKHHSFGDEY